MPEMGRTKKEQPGWGGGQRGSNTWVWFQHGLAATWPHEACNPGRGGGGGEGTYSRLSS